jgi:hypothetical protein
MFDITTTKAVNKSLLNMMEFGDKTAAKEFGLMFYTELTNDTKALYHHVYPKKKAPYLNYRNYDAPLHDTDRNPYAA